MFVENNHVVPTLETVLFGQKLRFNLIFYDTFTLIFLPNMFTRCSKIQKSAGKVTVFFMRNINFGSCSFDSIYIFPWENQYFVAKNDDEVEALFLYPNTTFWVEINEFWVENVNFGLKKSSV